MLQVQNAAKIQNILFLTSNLNKDYFFSDMIRNIYHANSKILPL